MDTEEKRKKKKGTNAHIYIYIYVCGVCVFPQQFNSEFLKFFIYMARNQDQNTKATLYAGIKMSIIMIVSLILKKKSWGHLRTLEVKNTQLLYSSKTKIEN